MRKKTLSEIFRCRNCTIMSFLTIVAFLLVFSAPLMGQTNKTATIKVHDKEIRTVIELLQKQTGLHFMYEEQTLQGVQKISLNYQNTSIIKILDDLCTQASLNYEIKRDLILLSKKVKPVATPSTPATVITGLVTDENGEGLVGVNVVIRQTKTGTITDMDGHFSLKANPGDILDFTFIGMEDKTVKITSNTKKLNITMPTSSMALDDVVVTGYQTLSKERASGSFATVSSKDMEGKLQTSLIDRLEGTVAGMTSYRGLQIRGVSTINGTQTPLYVVDGVPYEGTIAAINPSEVTNVTVLKDAAAASIYGARAANGVIVITTKNGTSGSTKVSYNGNIRFTPIYDTDYQNLMNSAEFVDFQQTLFNINPGTQPGEGYYMNEVRQLLFNHKNGKLSDDELNSQLDIYRHRDRKDQAMKTFVRTPAVTHQHNLSLTGGSEKYNYALSLNYLKELPYDKNTDSDRLGFNLKNTLRFTKWFQTDINILGSIYRQDKKNGHSGVGDISNSSKASYLVYWDEAGNELPWYQQKSQGEIDRLIGVGLVDETYYPLQEVGRRQSTTKDNYLNINANLKFIISKDLTFNLIFSKDFGNTHVKTLSDKDSYTVRNMINDAAQITDKGIVYNIPAGGQIQESRSDKNAYTVRAQVNYNKQIADKHQFSIIAGGERRAIKTTGTSMSKVGYDDNSLSFKLIDENLLASKITGTQSLTGTFTYGGSSGFSYNENRYVSFYGNASYTFNERASLTGSIRIDQSNLFGTDPKYQYRPLWSIGGQYTILKNKFGWIDRLAARMTYGINGNIPKTTGPFLTIQNSGINQWTGDYSSSIANPANSGLRWEKTGVYNVAIDFNLFKNRLNGSIEYYDKKTSDLLHNKTMDPTLGWGSIMVNYGKMYNRGVEITLKSLNIATKDFSWNTVLNFSYNKNKLTELEETKTDAIYYISGPQLRVGKPMNGLYSVRWAGLDEAGAPQAYKANGEIVKSFANLTTDDLVYSGSSTPPYAASLSNRFSYKNFSLSILFTYYGGNVMRGMFGNYLINTGYSTNQDKLTGNFWQKPGDENDPSKAPALKMNASTNIQNLWKAADRHIQKGDFLKLNEISLGYTLPTSLLKKTFIKGMRCMLQITDIHKWVANDMGLDPEVWAGTTLTPSRGQSSPATYTFGLSCNF